MIIQAKMHILRRQLPQVFAFYNCRNNSHYVQGQYPEPKLFLDDSRMKNFTSCFKEKKFLNFFFKRIRFNETNRYPEFPYVSLCGRERNFIRCDDLPIVYTHLVEKDNPKDTSDIMLAYGNAGDSMIVPFDASKVCMQPETGRVYYPAQKQIGGVGLIRSQLSIQLSTHFCFDDGDDEAPTHMIWYDRKVKLTQEALTALQDLESVRKYSLGLNDDPF
ncbi:UPF0598 protein CG30010 isoform X2 [Oratosquilla oratoria]|uniref:UPF0598 protein CG30010 isoform X2 n=1 Tax=Oratosquilla oratoria TaxID=337810 RepID=UPI003F772A54